jgi:drug/metabolite transporter (DMT)-like permease
LAYLALIIAAILWGSTFLVIQETMTHDIWFMVAMRHLIGALGVILLFRRRALYINKRQLKLWTWIGFLILCTFVPQAMGLRGSSVANSAVITALFVVLTPIVLLVTRKGKPSFMQWMGSCVGISAFAVLGWVQGFSSLSIYDAMTFITAVAVAFHTVAFSEAVQEKKFTYSIVAFQFLSSGIVLLIIHFLLNLNSPENFLPHLVRSEWLGLLYLGFFSMSIPYLLQAFAQVTLSPITVVLIISSEPLWAIATANIIRNDPISGAALFASCILLMANVIAEMKLKPSRN